MEFQICLEPFPLLALHIFQVFLEYALQLPKRFNPLGNVVQELQEVDESHLFNRYILEFYGFVISLLLPYQPCMFP
jgi:hypothetical protein